MWFGWVTDFGLPGADRGQGGSYLLVPPGYDGPVPEGGLYVRHSATNLVLMLGRAFIDHNEGNDPAPTVARIKEQLKIYPYAPGGMGSSIGSYLTGRGRLGQPVTPRSPRFVEGTGLAMQHGPAQRLRPLRDAGRAGADGAGRGAQHRAGRSVRRDRDRQGREIRSRRPAARDPGRGGGRRQRGLTDPGHGCAPDRGVPLLRRWRLGLVDPAVGRRVRVHQPPTDDHRGGHRAVPEQGCPPAALPHLGSSTPRPASPPRCACG